MEITCFAAAHKPYWFPEIKPYQPLQVGAILKEDICPGILRDDQGENISAKNRTFCELTGLYWIWKNRDEDVIGLCHYRRYPGNKKFWLPKRERLLRSEDIVSILYASDIILPQKRHYFIETRKSQYFHAHHLEDLRCTECVLQEKYPDYMSSWHRMLGSRSGHICNMFIMRHELFSEYCEWLFDILFEVESRLDISGYSEKDQRVFGYLGERLLDVWIMKNGLRTVEVPMINLENEHWPQKIFLFLKRKFKGFLKV